MFQTTQFNGKHNIVIKTDSHIDIVWYIRNNNKRRQKKRKDKIRKEKKREKKKKKRKVERRKTWSE